MDDDQLHLISRTVADPARLAALRLIASRGEASCSDLAAHLGLTPATISHHVRELASAGLVHQRREGKYLILSLNASVWNAWVAELARLAPAG